MFFVLVPILFQNIAKYFKEWEIDLTLMFIRKYKINNWYREISFYAHRNNGGCAKWMHNRVKCKVSL